MSEPGDEGAMEEGSNYTFRLHVAQLAGLFPICAAFGNGDPPSQSLERAEEGIFWHAHAAHGGLSPASSGKSPRLRHFRAWALRIRLHIRSMGR